MKRYLLLITIAVLMGLPSLGNAASIKNEDKEVHQIKGRRSGGYWVYVEVNPNGAKFFNCRHGCELILVKTGSEIKLESDADVIIKKGVLKIK